MSSRNRKRMQLVLIASFFLVPMLLAGVLTFSGWVPDARSYGQGIVPERSMEKVDVMLADGSRLNWIDPDWRWSVVALGGGHCADACIRQLDMLHRVRVSLNQNASRVRLVYVGKPPQGAETETLMKVWQVGSDTNHALTEWTPKREDGLAVLLVKPDGTALTWYADGFDAAGVRKDLAKVTK
ncbi:MAG: hypothetical protein EYC71_06635 [Gammaproteobacteria bacterium]|nr:MAG: hypothetical protein EYC71_06635 [Gammaproteobacteria bacterium]